MNVRGTDRQEFLPGILQEFAGPIVTANDPVFRRIDNDERVGDVFEQLIERLRRSGEPPLERPLRLRFGGEISPVVRRVVLTHTVVFHPRICTSIDRASARLPMLYTHKVM